MSQSAAAMWSEFAGRVIDPGAPPVQYTEMRMAFHAGMVAALSATRPGNPTPSWRRLWAEVSEFIRSDIKRVERDRAESGEPEPAELSPDDLHPDCRDSRAPRHVSVSRCVLHDRVELWVDGSPWALDDEQAWAIGSALVVAAAAQSSKNPARAEGGG